MRFLHQQQGIRVVVGGIWFYEAFAMHGDARHDSQELTIKRATIFSSSEQSDKP